MLLQPVEAATQSASAARMQPVGETRPGSGLTVVVGAGRILHGIGAGKRGCGACGRPAKRWRRLSVHGGGRKAGWGCGSGSGTAGVNPAARWGGEMGKSRGPVKTVRSGIFVQSAYFS